MPLERQPLPWEFSVVTSWDDLPHMAMDLLKLVGREDLFCGVSWFANFSRQVGEVSCEPRWLLLSHGEATRLLLPMMAVQERSGKTLKSLSNYYSPYFAPVVTPDEAGILLPKMFELARTYFKEFDVLEFSPLTALTRNALLQVSQGIGFTSESVVETFNWRQPKIKSFEDYWSRRDSRLRNTVKRKQRKLDATGEFRLTIAEPDHIERAIRDYQTVYARSWKPKENYPGFIEGLIRAYSEAGKLRLGLAYHGDNPVATQIWLINADEAYIYKLAYNTAYKDTSIGTLLTHHLFKHAVTKDRVQTVDYLTGDDAYKAQWMSERRPLYRLRMANPRRFRGAVQSIKQKLNRAS